MDQEWAPQANFPSKNRQHQHHQHHHRFLPGIKRTRSKEHRKQRINQTINIIIIVVFFQESKGPGVNTASKGPAKASTSSISTEVQGEALVGESYYSCTTAATATHTTFSAPRSLISFFFCTLLICCWLIRVFAFTIVWLTTELPGTRWWNWTVIMEAAAIKRRLVFYMCKFYLQLEMCSTVGIMKVSPFLSKNQTLLLLCLPTSSLRISACQLSCLTDIPRTNNKAAKNGEQKPLQY